MTRYRNPNQFTLEFEYDFDATRGADWVYVILEAAASGFSDPGYPYGPIDLAYPPSSEMEVRYAKATIQDEDGKTQVLSGHQPIENFLDSLDNSVEVIDRIEEKAWRAVETYDDEPDYEPDDYIDYPD